MIDEKNIYFRLTSAVAAFIVIAVFVTAWLLIASREFPVLEADDSHGETLDLSDVDFDNTLVNLPNDWQWYPEKFLLNSDFDDAGEWSYFAETPGSEKVKFGTHRLELQLQPDKIYSICGYSIDYSTRIYANGVAAAQSGVPSETSETAVPRINYLEFPVVSDSEGKLELVIHYSNYWHRDGGGIGSLYLSFPENIRRFNRYSDLPVMLLCGGLLLFCVYYALLGALRRKNENIMLAFCCIIFALRNQNFYVKMLIPPEYNWFVHYRLTVVYIALMPFAVLMLICAMYARERLAERLPTAVFCAVTALLVAVTFLLPTTVTSYLGDITAYCAAPFALYVLYSAVNKCVKSKHIGRVDILTIVGITILGIGFAFEMRFNRSLPAVTRAGVTPMCMLAFIMIMAIVQSVRSMEDERALEISRQREKMLEQINAANSDFFRKITHELKTPLTVISGYAQLNARRVMRGIDSQKTLEELDTVRSEAERLAEMVTKLAEYSYGKKSEASMTELSVSELCEEAAGILSPICAKRGNRLLLGSICDKTVCGNRELLLQVFINLVVNANRHTECGVIKISAEFQKKSGETEFIVADDGSGIPEEVRAHIFEKGYSADGSSGLGLTICEDIMKTHGGSIRLVSTSADGTVFAFRVPCR